MPSPVDPLDLSLGQTMRFGMPTLSLDAIKAGIVAGEVPNAADPYNTLLNYSNQPGMPFSNVNLTGMTVQEVLDFQRKRGPGSYASYAQNLPNVGRIATPAGKYQIVGDTLQGLVDQGVLDPNEKFGSEAQERAARALMEGRGLSAYMEGQLSEEQFLQNLSKEWEGFKPDVALGYGGTGGQTVSSPDGLPMSMGVGSPSDRLRASSSPAERTGIAATLGALGPYNTATYQNLPKEQRAAAIAASMLMPGAGLVQALGYRMNDREMQAAASMLEGKYEPRKGLFGIGADPKFERAEPVYDERTGQLVGAIGYDAKGSPVVYRGQRQGVQYSGPGADLVSSADDRSPGDGMGGEGQASVPGQESAAEPEAAIPNDPAAISIECPPGFRFDPATGSCQAENPWPTYRPPTPSERPPLTAYREVPDFQLQPLLPYPSGGIASL